MKDLSILIPSRNEMFLKNTIDDALAHIEADTEIIALLDGQWADPPILQHERVNIIYVNKAVGQRAGTNKACKLADGKYVMKVDAHCSFDQGFDRKMIEAFEKTGDNVTMVPIMRNLWAFDWKCYHCGWKKYQGPTPKKCEQCGKSDKIRRKMMWVGKHNPQSTSYCFDKEPHFQYSESYKHTPLYENGTIVGYQLLFDKQSFPSSIINLLADFTSSHHLSGGSYSFWGGENVAVDTMSLSSVGNSGRIGSSKIFSVRNELKMSGITTLPIFTKMIDNGNAFPSTFGERTNNPSIHYSMSELFLSELSTSSITPTVNPSRPIPATGDRINSNTIDELNNIIGGEFVYSEKTSSFHNGSIMIKPVYVKSITETMSLQGSCFMCTKDKYWELGLCDENLGNWGNQGIELACKTWLSGGRVLCNHNTWYAHMFRTQGGDFSFPWPAGGKDTHKTKENVKDLFWNKKWPKQVRPLSWLVERFMPVNGWTDEDLAKLKETD